jgi:hypothetical protein
VFQAQVETFKQHEYFSGCTWDVKAPGTEKESVYLRSELLRVLPTDLQRLFTNDTRYDNDGFLMLARLLAHLQPVSHQSKFLSMMEFANLTKGDNETEAALISRAKGIDQKLSGVSISDCMPLKILSCLSDVYPGLIARYCQGDATVVNATVNELEALMAAEREAQKAFPNLYPSASANRARGQPSGPSTSSTPSEQSMTYPLPKGAPWEKVEDLISSGEVCPVCHSRGKWHVNDGNYRCVPLARQGKIITSNQQAADQLVAEWDAYTQQHNGRSSGGRSGSGRGRSRGRGHGGRNNSSANNTTTAPPSSAPAPAPAPSPTDAAPAPSPAPDSHVRRATSAEPRASDAPASLPGNRYGVLDREMASDSDDDAAYGDMDFALADKTNDDYAYPVSACRASAVPGDSCRFVSSALSSVATKHFEANQNSISSPISTATQAVADSGATDNMFPDYTAFISYRRQYNRFVTLGDDTRLPILGEGSAKIKLNGKVVILRNNASMYLAYVIRCTLCDNIAKCRAVECIVITTMGPTSYSPGLRCKSTMTLIISSPMNPSVTLFLMLKLTTVNQETTNNQRLAKLPIYPFHTTSHFQNVYESLHRCPQPRRFLQPPLPTRLPSPLTVSTFRPRHLSTSRTRNS